MTGVKEIPDWWEMTLLVAAALRVWILLARDSILDPLRLRLLWPIDEEGQPYEREKLAELIDCPWCLGFWIVIAAWALWLLFPTETIWLSVPFTMSLGVGFGARLLP